MARARTKSRIQLDRRIERYEDDSMGLPVVLIDSTTESSFGGDEGIIVPDIKGLEAAMAVARVTNPNKLSGREIKFLRKAIGLKATKLASFLDVVPETLSRWENGREVISTNPERILRLRVLRALKDKAQGIPAEIDDILEMTFVSVRDSTTPITPIFERVQTLVQNVRQWIWVYQGIVEPEIAEEASKNIA